MSSFNKDISAKLSNLMYSKALNINTPRKNGESQTVYDQFYDNDGNIRSEVDSSTALYLQSNPDIVSEIQEYNVAAISGDNLNGYAGMVVSPVGFGDKAMVVNRGTEITSITDIATDVAMGVDNIFNDNYEVSQLGSAEKLLFKAREAQPDIQEVSATGHSLGGALAIAVQKSVIQNQDLQMGETYAYNPPGFADVSTEGMTAEQIQIMKSKSHVYSVSGDPVSETWDDHITPPEKIYSSSDGGVIGFDYHSMAPIVTENATTFYTDYLNQDNTLNETALATRLSFLNEVSTDMKALITGMDSMDKVTSYAAGVLGVANSENPYAILAAAEAELLGLQNMLGNFASYQNIESNYATILENHEFITESLGGEQAQTVLDKVTDAGENLDITAKEQFINSLKDNPFIKGVIDATLGLDRNNLNEDIDTVSQNSESAQAGTTQTIRRDPLTLDLDNDGIETISSDGSVKFDSNADGVKRGTGWVGADDGLLVRDLDGDGDIENGQELFGDATVKRDGSIASDGFDALSDLDNNNDGVFDANDEAFDSVQVWQDANSDGISQANELRGLADAGMASINLDATSTTTATDGGIISKTGSYTRTDGTTAEIGNLDFNQNAIYREYVNKLDTSAFASMMSMAGIGEVRDLQESATQSTKLADLLGQMNTENYTTKLGLADDLLSEWKNTSDFSDTTNLETITLADGTSFKFDISDSTRAQLDKLQVLETFSSNKLIQTNLNGDTLTITSGNKARNYTIVRGRENVLTDGHFTSGWTTYRSGWTNVTDLNLGSINSGYNTLLTNIKENIFSQTEYPKVLENLQFEFNAETSEIDVNFDGVNEYLNEISKDAPLSGIMLASKLETANDSSFVENGWDSNNVMQFAIGSIGVNELNDSDISLFNNANISVDGKQVRVNKNGGSGSQIVLGDSGDNILTGDTYSGSTNSWTRYDEARYYKGNDVLAGGKGNDTLAGGYGSDTYIFNKGDGVDTIQEMSRNDYAGRRYDKDARDTIKFSEGLNQKDININLSGKDLLVNFKDNETDQLVLKDFMSNNTINNFEFADSTKLDRNNFMSLDTLEGTDEADNISGFDAAETILAGGGNDSIYGNSGNDYISGEAGDDYLRGGNNNDTLAGGEGSDKLYGNNHNDSLDGGSGDDYLHGGSQSDTLEGGAGDDVLHGDNIVTSETGYNRRTWRTRYDEARYYKGNDILAGGKGNDTLAGGYGSDTYIFNKGDGVDTIQEMLRNDRATKYVDYNSRDTIKFGEGIQASDLNFAYDGNDAHVTFKGTDTDKLILKNFQGSTLDKFEFADGTTLTKSDIKIGTAGDDTLVGNDNTNIISGNEDDDTITGGKGDDVLEGGAGADTYNYSAGDGNDTINLTNDGETDTLNLTDISKDQVSFSRDGDDLKINLGDALSSANLKDYFDEQYEGDGIIIDTQDDFQLQLSKTSAKMAEIIAGMNMESDSDGGSVDGTNQVNTKVDASQLTDLWVPKSEGNN